MDLETALNGISAKSYWNLCGLNYSGLKYYGFNKKKFDELPPVMQLGIKRLINDLYRIQKMTFYYELDYILLNLKKCGIQLKKFFDCAGLNQSFYSNKYLSINNYSEYILNIRLQIIKIINRLFSFMFNDAILNDCKPRLNRR